MSNNFHLQLYRGTTQQNNAYTGPAGELTVDTTLSKLRLHDGSTAGGVEIGGMPTGSIIPYAGSTVPAGYLLCDGSVISRSTYSALFAIIGTTYGAGDGNSTFNLPDLNGRVLQGADNDHAAGTSIAAGLPNITGYHNVTNGYNDTIMSSNYLGGAFYKKAEFASRAAQISSASNIACDFGFDASRLSSIYGNSNTVQPPALSINFCIKY